MASVLLDHPLHFRDATRVLMLTGRNKDEPARQRKIMRVTHDADAFAQQLNELFSMLEKGERIYASLDSRSVLKAARHFKHAQVDAEHEPFGGVGFYEHLEARWVGSLMQATSRVDKRWLFDCDDEALYRSLAESFAKLQVTTMYPYAYKTKNGWHIVTHPFDQRVLTEAQLGARHVNAMMLWGWYDD